MIRNCGNSFHIKGEVDQWRITHLLIDLDHESSSRASVTRRGKKPFIFKYSNDDFKIFISISLQLAPQRSSRQWIYINSIHPHVEALPVVLPFLREIIDI